MFNICRIIVETKEDSNNLKEYLGGYPVDITQDIPEDLYFEIPTLMIGWNSVKNNFPNQNIGENKITENLTWSYNLDESSQLLKKENFHRNIDDFINKNINNWLPSDFILYDAIMHGDIYKFIKENINQDEISFVHFNAGAIYIRNDFKNFTINVKSLNFIYDDFREIVTSILNNLNCMVYSYNNIEDYVDLETMGNIISLDILKWIKFGVETPIKYFQVVPNIDIHKYIPFLMSKISLHNLELNEQEVLFFERMSFRDKVTRWMSTRYISFSYDFKKNLDFLYRDKAKLAKIHYSTKRTITGRITNVDKYYPQNLEKEGVDRSMIISRFEGGKIYQFDYTSFEARIALYLSEDEDFIQDYYNKDLHSETARIIFESYEFTPEQRDIAKNVNHSILYGAGEATVLKKLQGLENPEEKMLHVKRFIYPLYKKAKELMDIAESQGYIINKWGSIIKPEKSYAGFNNYIQSTASEIIVDKVWEMKTILHGNRSQFLFQVHDSLVFDIHPDEIYLIPEIAKSLSYNKGMLFSVNFKSGPNYKDLSSETIYF